MTDLTIAYIGLGSNLGDRHRSIQQAVEMVSKTPGLRLVRQSRIIETLAAVLDSQPDYLNTVLEIKTSLEPQALLKCLQEIELRLGRVRTGKWGPRTIDLDILLYGDSVISSSNLCVPHRLLHLRHFVLSGLNELCPDRIHPVLHRPMSQLAARLNGQNFIPNPGRPQLISVAGLIGVGKTTLTRGLAENLSAQAIFEEFDKNPYLAEVYAGKKELALSSELYFLSSSVRQLSPQILQSGRIYVNDYVFEKALVYARSWLGPDDLAEYETIYPQQHQQAVLPAVVIYLEDTVDHCLERIHRRQRPFEQSIEPAFLNRLQTWYNDLFQNWTTCPVIRVSAGDCRQSEQVESLAREISWYLSIEEKQLCNWYTQ